MTIFCDGKTFSERLNNGYLYQSIYNVETFLKLLVIQY